MAEQSLGQALQEVYATVNTELGLQEDQVIFRTQTTTENTTFGLSDAATTVSDVSFYTGIKVSWAKQRDLDPGQKVMLNDLKLEVPGSLIAEANLKNSEIVYRDQTYTLVTYSPLEILSGVVVRWQVFGRAKT